MTHLLIRDPFSGVLSHAIDVDFSIDADWAKVIRDEDYTDISLGCEVGISYELWGGEIKGSASGDWDPFGVKEPGFQLYMITWTSDPF